MDEMWIVLDNPGTKHQSTQWKTHSTLPLKKLHNDINANKIITALQFSGVLHS
jgi:hypothetical protein